MNKEEARRRQNRATRRNFFVLVILSAIGAVFYQADAPPKTDGSMIIIAVIGVLWVAWLLAELVGRLYIMLRFASTENKQTAVKAAVVGGGILLVLLKLFANSQNKKTTAKSGTIPLPKQPVKAIPQTPAKKTSEPPRQSPPQKPAPTVETYKPTPWQPPEKSPEEREREKRKDDYAAWQQEQDWNAKS